MDATCVTIFDLARAVSDLGEGDIAAGGACKVLEILPTCVPRETIDDEPEVGLVLGGRATITATTATITATTATITAAAATATGKFDADASASVLKDCGRTRGNVKGSGDRKGC